ncbi:MAG TPA: Calx-beta domain-containing protein, partial [Pyrinomonadaceae bacterium]|nr:Calx-beta domain-containing protein [Pyrinomonadaceae bacterium]
GLVIKSGGSTVRGLAVVNFRNNAAISLISCDNNVIQANYVGLAADGTTPRHNSRGIVLTGSANNVIGGTTAAVRNIISGNTSSGVEISGNGNVVQGNYIGTNAAGTAQLANGSGVTIANAASENNVIGGTAAGAGNLISGNQLGVANNGTGTTIQGNLIGTDVTGTKKIPNFTGVQALGPNMLVGGLTPGARNIISGNADGLSIRGTGSKVQGNFIGTDITGTLALGNTSEGVIAADNALVGGTVPEARNIISASGGQANVQLGDFNSDSPATVQGNFIGTDVTGTRSLGGSAVGVRIMSGNNVVGGLVPGARNVISGNLTGIQISSSFSTPSVGNVIQGNLIGLNATGTGPLPNTQHGISVGSGVNNTIGGTQSEAANKIAFNGGAGIAFNGNGLGNRIRGNSIFSNNGLGIDLFLDGVTLNDANDVDSGPNTLQNFPVITTVMSTSSSTTIQGSLNSLPNTTFQIDFYSNAAVDPSGHGEGAQFFNTTAVTTNSNGNATINVTFPVALAAGRVITATATDPNGNTSEFSAADPTTAVGSVQFTISSIQVIEDIGSLVLTVQRTGGGAGNLAAEFSTTDGTAIAGQDYTSTSGTLTFAPGETSKTIQIPIANDATTEADENFTVALRNNSSLEAVGAPAVVQVTIQDRTTVPELTVTSFAVVEGNTGTTTDAGFTINLSAATGRAVTGNFIIFNFSAFGGAKCGMPGVDYETAAAGSFSINPGSTTFTIPVKICGDSSAEADEIFVVQLSNASGATILFSQGTGTIGNDDILELAIEESGPIPGQAVALDAILAVRDPFKVVGIPDWFTTALDRNTRVVLFARNLQLNPGEFASAVTIRFVSSTGQTIETPAQDVRPVPDTDLTQVTARLPTGLAPGTCTIFIRAHTRVSNTGTIRIVP